MPRNPNTETDRATIAKLRVRIAQLEAKLADAKDYPLEPDLKDWTLDQRIKSYAPTREEEDELQAEFVSSLIQFGWNRGILNREKLLDFITHDYPDLPARLNLDSETCRYLGEDLFNKHNRDLADLLDPKTA